VNNATLMTIFDGVDDLPELISSVHFRQSPVTGYHVCITAAHMTQRSTILTLSK